MSAVRRRASGLWRTGGQERASTAHDHKTITFTHFDGLAWFLTTHTIGRLSMDTKIVPQARHAGLAQPLVLCRGLSGIKWYHATTHARSSVRS